MPCKEYAATTIQVVEMKTRKIEKIRLVLMRTKAITLQISFPRGFSLPRLGRIQKAIPNANWVIQPMNMISIWVGRSSQMIEENGKTLFQRRRLP